MSYFPLINFHTISCPLYNSKIVRVISMKLGTLIKHDEIIGNWRRLMVNRDKLINSPLIDHVPIRHVYLQ